MSRVKPLRGNETMAHPLAVGEEMEALPI